MKPGRTDSKLEDLEIDLLIEGIRRYYGYDFRGYKAGGVKRRVREAMLASRISTVSKLQEKVLHDPAFLERFLSAFSNHGLSMFSDSGFYKVFRSRVVPLLKTYPFIRIWQLGCSSGEETYSLAILLEEEGIYQRSRIYATDLSEKTVRQARRGVFPSSAAESYAANYLRSGGKGRFDGYYKKEGDRLIINQSLKKFIVFSEHNPATDGSFNEFQAVICRGVLPSFSQALRARVDGLIYESLSRFGILALGASESLEALPHQTDYLPLADDGVRFYQKTDFQLRAQANSI